jgi:hypothetical protein
VWAGLNLTDDDLVGRAGAPTRQDPTDLVRAVAAVWLFTGLRNDELRRLPVGCVRWQPSGGENGPICLLDVPANKTGAGFTKPVDRLVGEAITKWEAVRPQQEPLPDPQLVHPRTISSPIETGGLGSCTSMRRSSRCSVGREECLRLMPEARLPATALGRRSPLSCTTPRSP